jgi:hypothetical protein
VLRNLAWCLAALLLPCAANAEKGLIAQQSVEVKASPKTVWALVKNFDGLHKWHPAFKDDVIKSGKNNAKGAMRTADARQRRELRRAAAGIRRQEDALQVQNRRRLAISGRQLLFHDARHEGQEAAVPR